MTRLILRKFAQFVVVIVAVTFFVTVMLRLTPNDTVDRIYPTATEAQKAEFRAELGIDEPLLSQYWNWLSNALRADLGTSLTPERMSVGEQIRNALPPTLQLIVLAQLLALVIAIPFGVWSAARANGPLDKATSVSSFALLAIPNYVLGLLLAYVVGVRLEWLPTQGYTAFGDSPVDWLRYMILPTITLAAAQIAIYQRLLRSDMITTLQSDFITTARAKGVSHARTLWRHALRPSSFTLLTIAAINLGALIGGAVVIEVIFQLPGMGKLIADAIFKNDYVTVQGCVAVIAIGYVLLNFAVDIGYTLLDPRTRRTAANV